MMNMRIISYSFRQGNEKAQPGAASGLSNPTAPIWHGNTVLYREAAFARRKRRKAAGAGSSTLFDSIACTSARGHGANTVAPRRCTASIPPAGAGRNQQSIAKSTYAICIGFGAAAGVGRVISLLPLMFAFMITSPSLLQGRCFCFLLPFPLYNPPRIRYNKMSHVHMTFVCRVTLER